MKRPGTSHESGPATESAGGGPFVAGHLQRRRRRGSLCLASSLLTVLIALGSAAGASGQEPAPAQSPPTASSTQGVPVTLDGETLFYLIDHLGPFSPEERARAAENRLLRIAEDPFYRGDLFTIEVLEGKAAIRYRGENVGIVTAEEAAKLGGSPEEVATNILSAAQKAIAQYRERRLPEARTRAGMALGVMTVLLVMLLFGLRYVHRRLRHQMELKQQAGTGMKVRGRLILRAEECASVVLPLLRFLRALITAVLIIAYLEAAFSIMPLTRGYALTLLYYFMDPLRTLWRGFEDHLGDLAFILVVVVLARLLLKALRWLLSHLATGGVTLPGLSPEWAMTTYKLIRLVFVGLTVVVVYPYIPGSDTEAFKGISLVAGALFTLGASGAAGNFIGGISLVFSKAFRVGDWVRIGDVMGSVLESTLLFTRIRTIRNEVVTIPTSKILGGEMVNFSAKARDEGLILYTSVTIGYDAPWRKVHELLIQAARRTPGILQEPAPFVYQRALNDFYVNYEINAYTRNASDMIAIYSDLHQNIQDAFNEGGVEIMSPHYTSLRDGNAVTIPDQWKPEGYEAPSFGIRTREKGGG